MGDRETLEVGTGGNCEISSSPADAMEYDRKRVRSGCLHDESVACMFLCCQLFTTLRHHMTIG